MKGGRKKANGAALGGGGGSSSSDTVHHLHNHQYEQQRLIPANPYEMSGGAIDDAAVAAAAATVAAAAAKVAARELQNGFEKEGYGGEERDNEEAEEEEEGEGFDRYDNLEIEEEGEGEEEAELRPKLAEGFYEIEAVRRKRVRKGQVQYLIKWRGWPETANTWEPFENLLSCSDVIEAFEESLRLGKRSSRKRKRRSGGPTPQAKKKPQCSSVAENYSVPAGKVKFTEENFLISCPHNESRKKSGESNIGGINNVKTSEQVNENGCSMIPPQIEEGKEQNEVDVNLSELTGIQVTNNGHVDNLAVDIQESETSEVVCLANGHDQSKVDGEEPAQVNRRLGSRRRKSGSVKRFKQEQALCVTNYAAEDVTTKNTRSCGIARQQWDQYSDNKGNAPGCKSKSDNVFAITEIVKPISFVSSEVNNVQDIAVNFIAKRSDGTEVMVDNKYLKAKNPLLLINYYERHLKYTADA